MRSAGVEPASAADVLPGGVGRSSIRSSIVKEEGEGRTKKDLHPSSFFLLPFFTFWRRK
jgi:hypothetical protein